MRIAKGSEVILTEAPTRRFLLVVDAMDGEVTVKRGEEMLISLSLDAVGGVSATLSCADGRVLRLYGEDAYHKEVILTSGYARVGLYVGGVLMDEDFFLAPVDYLGATVSAGSYMHFEAGYEYHSMWETAITPGALTAVDGYRPIGREMTVRAVLPHLIGERLHLFYLDCRREGSAKRGAGAYRLDALYTEDGKTYGKAPMALPIDSVEELSMRDAALLSAQGRHYLYYLVDYRGGRALTCAVSEDGFSYAKTGLDILIPTLCAADVRAIAACRIREKAFLVYATQNGVYLAESRDLLYFHPPKQILLEGGITALHTAEAEGRTYLFAQGADGVAVYDLSDGVQKADIPLPAWKGVRGVFYQNAWHWFGIGDAGEIKHTVS